MKVSSWFLIKRLKDNAKKLYANYQLPYCLVKRIDDLDIKTEDKEYIQWLMSMSEHCLRVRGYYKKYKGENALIEKMLIESEKDFYERRKQ